MPARLGHSYVGCEHLLLGLASQEYSPAACALRKAGADSHTLRCAIGQPGWDRSARPLPPSRTDAQLLSGDSGCGGGEPPTGSWGGELRAPAAGVTGGRAKWRHPSVDRLWCGTGPAVPTSGRLPRRRGAATQNQSTGAGGEDCLRHQATGPVRPGSDSNGRRGKAGPGYRTGGGAGPSDSNSVPADQKTPRPSCGSREWARLPWPRGWP